MTRHSALAFLFLALLCAGCARRSEVSHLAERVGTLEENVLANRTDTLAVRTKTDDLELRVEYLEEQALRSGVPAARPAPRPAGLSPGGSPVPPGVVPSPPSLPALPVSPLPLSPAPGPDAPSLPGVLPAEAAPPHGQDRAEKTEAPSTPTPAPAQKEQNAYDASLRLYRSGRFAEADAAFQAFLEVYPGSRLVPNALYWKGETHYARQQYNEAIFAFKDVQTRFPRDAKTPDSLLKTAMAYSRLGDEANASLHLTVLYEDWPNAEAIARARQMGLKP